MFSLGKLAEASPSLFVMMLIDVLGPVCMSRTGLVGGSTSCYDAMVKQFGIPIAEVAHAPYLDYLIDDSGSQTDLAMRKTLMYYRPASYAEAYHPGSSFGHTFVICGYHFIPTASEDSYYICENFHWENGTTFHGALLIKINFLHAWAGQHLIERDITCWNHDITTKKGGFGRLGKFTVVHSIATSLLFPLGMLYDLTDYLEAISTMTPEEYEQQNKTFQKRQFLQINN